MLHQILESAQRSRLLEVVELQRQLIEALCALPLGSTVDVAWLRGVWTAVPADWVERFWEIPRDTSSPAHRGLRALWISTIAAGAAADKQTTLTLIAEQLRFAELYHAPATVRLTSHNWSNGIFFAVNKLLKSFYDPLFYKDNGFRNPTGENFHKEHFIAGFDPRIKICPYTDNFIQDTKLDHFLPKDQFPMLSCHPDNLIPCSTDANSGSHKGTKTPLDLNAPDQAADWFHPRWRTAMGTYRLTFAAGSLPQPRINFVATAPQDQTRLNNMANMFGLNDFWGGFLDDEVQSVAGDVQGWLRDDGKAPTEPNVRDYVLKRARQERGRIGRDGLAIVKSYFYEHIAHTPVLLAQVVRTCANGT